ADDLRDVMPLHFPPPPGEVGEEKSEEVVEEDGIHVPPITALAIDRVRFVGEPVAVVIAESKQTAEDAVSLVYVDVESLPAVVTPYDAMAEGAQLLYDKVKNNIGVREYLKEGDPDAALASSPIRIKANIREPRCHAIPMETRGIVAQVDPILGGMTFWSSTQAPHWNRNSIAEALNLPQSAVRCIAPEVGGGFGAKIGAYVEEFVIAAACWKLKQPIKWIESRSESMLGTSHGRNQYGEFEAAADENGKLTALKARVLLDSGAYPKDLSLAWSTWVMSTGPYNIPNVEYEVLGVYTNTMANGAYRGAGRPEAAFYLERVIDMIADAGGLDPAEVRRINFLTPDMFPYTTLSGEHYDTGEYEKPLDHALELADYKGLRAEQERLRKEGRYIGIGISSYVEICGFGPYDSAKVRVEPSGAVSIFTGVSPHGQGTETTFAQMTEQHLGASFDDVVVHHGDTNTNPQGNGTMGSRGLAVGGAALLMALNKIKDKAMQIAASMLEAAVEDIELVDGRYQVKGVPDRGVSLAEIADRAYSGDMPDDIEVGLETTSFFKPSDETFPFGTHISVVEVFPETGEIKLLKHLSVDDCGNIITPFLVTGQVHGGLAQGLGQVTLEEIIYDESGELLTGTLNDYAVPRAHHFPNFESHHTTTPTYINPMGAKGIGEAATIGATPAAANAVIDALSYWGITHLDTPFPPEKVWRAIQEASANATAAD
ncbi:MAG: xanthine dehydrogenase family protein molybdopterin-binding subunit, partial [Chloroflexota bacterium]|nr:xanthine dehydrogenase family protein molybdopterin-binding subunit [Chloroflexota bacterium]